MDVQLILTISSLVFGVLQLALLTVVAARLHRIESELSMMRDENKNLIYTFMSAMQDSVRAAALEIKDELRDQKKEKLSKFQR